MCVYLSSIRTMLFFYMKNTIVAHPGGSNICLVPCGQIVPVKREKTNIVFFLLLFMEIFYISSKRKATKLYFLSRVQTVRTATTNHIFTNMGVMVDTI